MAVVGNRMGNIYLTFQVTDRLDSELTKRNWVTRTTEHVIGKIVAAIIPKANPDFDNKIKKVKKWMLEIDGDSGVPNREIGVDENGDAIMIMPWENNYGYWADNNLKLNDFEERFNPTLIDCARFEGIWDQFEQRN